MEIKIKLDSPIYGECKIEFKCAERETALLLESADFRKLLQHMTDDFENHQVKKPAKTKAKKDM